MRIKVNMPVTSLYAAFIAATFGGGMYLQYKNEEDRNSDRILFEGAVLELSDRLMAIKWEAEREFIETSKRNDELEALIRNSELAKYGRFTRIAGTDDLASVDNLCLYLRAQEKLAQDYLNAASPEEIARLIKNPEELRIAANDDTPAEKALCRGISP